MERELVPIRSRAAEIAKNPRRVEAILEAGAERARSVARETMLEVKTKMGLR
jgi:tryptophanyl-tRNA synthetase